MKCFLWYFLKSTKQRLDLFKQNSTSLIKIMCAFCRQTASLKECRAAFKEDCSLQTKDVSLTEKWWNMFFFRNGALCFSTSRVAVNLYFV